ncbi:MAG: rod shape-determining protein [Parcubacteria group bacterium RIFCSPHIGHO2_01_FULL_47_10b]|nr:MAG: rod shape-determining protein [Parcubacteria group bacterium RIFCSPHIGHO2_01_FULL_47_10b]
MSFFRPKLGIDLGTANTLVFAEKRGIIINEPSVVAISEADNRVLAVGEEAKQMIGRTPESITAYKPLKNGVIADYRSTEAMLRYFINKAGASKFIRPEVLISVPSGVTSAERRAVIKAAHAAGARAVYIIKEPVLAALGAGIPINESSGNMIINVGGGTSEIAVISLGGIVSSTSVRTAGNKIDQAIADFIKHKHNLAIGERTAEEIKILIGSALSQEDEEVLEIRGRDLFEGLPRNIEISTNEITEAITPVLMEIIDGVRDVLAQTPPELSADVMNKGMVITGGSALLKNFDKLIENVTKVPCFMSDEPLLCVAKGTGIALENLDLYKRSILTKA